MRVRLNWERKEAKHVGVAVFNKKGEYIYGTNTYVENAPILRKNSIEYHVKLNLIEGDYFLKVGLFGDNDKIKIDFEENGSSFTVNRKKGVARWEGVTQLESEWR